jgi:tRNA(Ile2) C34 agmatinyltransferase TiaS
MEEMLELVIVEESPACLACGSPRMDWTADGWRCQDCGAFEYVTVAERRVA